MPHKTTAFFNRNYLDYGAQDEALRQRGVFTILWVGSFSSSSMNTKKLFITILFIGIQITNGQNQSNIIDHTQEHIQFLEDFYTKYISIGYNLSSTDFLEEYCTKKLICKISESKIDYDPFIFAQDIWTGVLKYLKVEKYGTQKNVYEVSYHYLNQDDNDRLRIRLEVTNTPDGFKLIDIISAYKPGVGLHYPLGR